MYIKKVFQGELPENKILDAYSESKTDAYSCNYLNGTELYSDETGTTGNITLNDNIPNYKCIEVFAKDGDGALFPAQKYFINNKNSVSIKINGLFNVDGGVYPSGSTYTITGTSMTFKYHYRAIVVDGFQPYAGSSTSNIYITKIIGYK